MNVLRELSQAMGDTYRLQRRFYGVTWVVGLLGGAAGIGLMLLAGIFLGSSLGVDANAPLRSQTNGIAWFALFLGLIPVTIYIGFVVVAGSFATVMVLLGHFTKDEAIRYPFLPRYPRNWLKD